MTTTRRSSRRTRTSTSIRSERFATVAEGRDDRRARCAESSTLRVVHGLMISALQKRAFAAAIALGMTAVACVTRVYPIERADDRDADVCDAGPMEASAGDAAIQDATLVDSPADAAATAAFRVFSFTGRVELFVVPDGVTTLDVKVWGASGGCTFADDDAGVHGGHGGFATHHALEVSPGETLHVLVGGPGTGNAGLNLGGFGGGGNGSNEPAYVWSASGGGRSAVVRAGSDVIAAGGGGGCGYPALSGSPVPLTGSGGAGCATVTGEGGDATGVGAGGGARVDAGGGAGTAPGATPGFDGHARRGADGLVGGMLASGGGGGGYFGGGSGAHAEDAVSGAGGGGSCFGPPGTLFDPGGGVFDPDFDPETARGSSKAGIGKPGRIIVGW